MKGYLLKVNMRSADALMEVIRSIEELGPAIECRIQPSPNNPCVLHVIVEQVRRDPEPKSPPMSSDAQIDH